MQPVTYWRKTYSVQAVRLTPENIRDIAEAIGGDYSEDPNNFSIDRETPVPHVTLTTSMAFIGDWVVEDEKEKYKFYTHEDFMREFHTHDEEMATDERYAKIFMLVASAMSKQDAATYHGDQTGMDLLVIETVKKIIGEL